MNTYNTVDNSMWTVGYGGRVAARGETQRDATRSRHDLTRRIKLVCPRTGGDKA